MEDWQDKAKQNIAKWGVQDAKTLICLLTEELGELAQAVLRYIRLTPSYESSNDIQAILNEIDDLKGESDE